MSNDANHLAVFLDLGQIAFDLLFAQLVLPFLGRLGERLLLRAIPVLIQATTAIFRDVFGPDGLQRSQAARSLDVADDTYDNHRWRLQKRNGFDSFFLVQFRAWLVHFANHVRHTGLVADESGQMHRLGPVVLRERLYFAAMTNRPLLGHETHRSVARSRKLAVRHFQ